MLDLFHASRPIAVVIHGAAPRVDTWAGEWAEARGLSVLRFPADWNRYGRRAGPLRNAQMLAEGLPHIVLAFPGGNGTANMVAQAKRKGIPVYSPCN